MAEQKTTEGALNVVEQDYCGFESCQQNKIHNSLTFTNQMR